MVAVTNSLAMGTFHEKSDIDLFIVAEAGHLYTVRLLLKIMTQLFGVRVHHDYIAGRFCMSFVVTMRAMNLGPIALPFDPHLAEFACTMMPLFDAETYREWCTANESWLSHYGRLMPRMDRLKDSRFLSVLRSGAEALLDFLGTVIERISKKILLPRDLAYQKRFPEADCILTDDIFKFHENDPRRRIAEEWPVSTARPPRRLSLSPSQKIQTFDEFHSQENVGMKSE